MKTGEAEKRYEEIVEVVETFEKGRKRAAGVVALTAVLLALATMMSHRTHTKEVIVEGDRNTQWANYDRKRTVQHMYEADATIAALLNGGETAAAEFQQKANAEKEGEKDKHGVSDIIEEAKKLDKQLINVRHEAYMYDLAELLLEMSLVLCSFSILQNSQPLYTGSQTAAIFGSLVFLSGFLIAQWPALYPDKLLPS